MQRETICRPPGFHGLVSAIRCAGNTNTGNAGAQQCRPLPFMRNALPTAAMRQIAASHLQELRRVGLTGSMIRALLRALVEENARYRIMDASPTIGDDRHALEAVQSLAIRLAHALQSVSPGVWTENAPNTVQHVGYGIGAASMIQAVNQFSKSCDECLERMPKQSRRRNHANIIARIAVITAPLKISISPRAGTAFYRVCAAAFALAGVTKAVAKKGSNKAQCKSSPSPSASIRAYLKSADAETI